VPFSPRPLAPPPGWVKEGQLTRGKSGMGRWRPGRTKSAMAARTSPSFALTNPHWWNYHGAGAAPEPAQPAGTAAALYPLRSVDSMDRSSFRKYFATSVVIGALWASGVQSTLACPYCIREAGFIVRDVDPYRVVFFVRPDTPVARELPAWVEQSSKRLLGESNVEAEVVDLEAATDNPALKHYRALKEPAPPAAILVSPRGQAMQLPLPTPLTAESVHATIGGVVSSPARDEVLGHIIRDWAVVLVVPGPDEAETAAVQRAATRAAGTVAGSVTEMGHRIKHPPFVMTIELSDQAEQVLLWSLGLTEPEEPGAQVAILYGMGRRLGKTLSAVEASQPGLVDRFKLLGRNCTCTTDPSWVLGPAAPLSWTEDLQILTREALGFDPNSPAVLMTLAGAWKSLREQAEGASGGAIAPQGADYIEFPAEPADPDAPPPQEQGVPPPLGAPRTDVEREGYGIVMKTALGLAGIGLVGGAVLIIRAIRNA